MVERFNSGVITARRAKAIPVSPNMHGLDESTARILPHFADET
jgi:hypothetical protein